MIKPAVLLIVSCLVGSCTNSSPVPVTSVPESYKVVSRKSESELGYSLEEYQRFQVSNKIQVVGNGIKATGVIDYDKGMTVREAIERSGGVKTCFDLDSVSVKRVELGYLLILNAPLTAQLLSGDAVYVNCAR